MFQTPNISWYCNPGELSYINQMLNANVICQGIKFRVITSSDRSPFTTNDGSVSGTNSHLKIDGRFSVGMENHLAVCGVQGTVSNDSGPVFNATNAKDPYKVADLLYTYRIDGTSIPASHVERGYNYAIGIHSGYFGLTGSSG